MDLWLGMASPAMAPPLLAFGCWCLWLEREVDGAVAARFELDDPD